MCKNSKLIELESKIAFQDRAIEELSDSLFKMDKKLAAVELLCESLKTKLSSLSQQSGLEVGEHNEKPPHY